MDKLIYFDHAATTPTRKEVVDGMLPYFYESYGNPSSIYSFAGQNKEAIEDVREKVAKAIGGHLRERFSLHQEEQSPITGQFKVWLRIISKKEIILLQRQ